MNPIHQQPIDDCWNRIGIRGDRRCEKLHIHLHCHHCEVFAGAAQQIMGRALPGDYEAAWATHFAAPLPTDAGDQEAVLVFRVGAEWFALPARLAVTIAENSRPHRLPHRTDDCLLGVVNVKGRFYPCMSLASLLQVDLREPPLPPGRRIFPRLLLMQLEQQVFALPVQDVHGIHRFPAAQMEAAPSTASRDGQSFLQGVLQIDAMRVGYLDAELLGHQLVSRIK